MLHQKQEETVILKHCSQAGSIIKTFRPTGHIPFLIVNTDIITIKKEKII